MVLSTDFVRNETMSVTVAAILFGIYCYFRVNFELCRYSLIVLSPFLQKFFLQGRFIFGPDARSLALTIFLIVAPVVVFCIYVARKLIDDYSDHWGISIIAVAVAFTIYVSLSRTHTLHLCISMIRSTVLCCNSYTLVCTKIFTVC